MGTRDWTPRLGHGLLQGTQGNLGIPGLGPGMLQGKLGTLRTPGPGPGLLQGKRGTWGIPGLGPGLLWGTANLTDAGVGNLELGAETGLDLAA